jgi:urease accessory protein
LLFAAQYADSAYPAGGFAQSFGFETAVADGMVSDLAGLTACCRYLLVQQAGPTDAVAAAACCRATSVEQFITIDRRLGATKPARESRIGSQQMGARLIETAAAAEGDERLHALRDLIRAGTAPGHHAAVFGALCGWAGLTPAQAAALQLSALLTGVLNAALRLLPLTHDDAQRLQAGFRPLIADLAVAAVTSDPLQMAGSAPLLEIWSMRHEQAHTRLFAS